MTDKEIIDELCKMLSDYEDAATPEQLVSRVKYLVDKLHGWNDWASRAWGIFVVELPKLFGGDQ